MSLYNLKLRTFVFFSLIYATTIQPAAAATSTKQFKHWYPQYGWIFETIVKVNCTAEYDKYLTGFKNHSEIDYLGGGGIYTAITQPLVECILEHTSEYLKVAMTGAQVLLGVMPTIIALLGPSHDEIAMLCIVGRRPLLAAGLALASPSAYFSRAFEYSEPINILSVNTNRYVQSRPKAVYSQLLLSAAEYLITTAACYNVLDNTLQANLRAIFAFSPDADFLPGLWLAIGIALHIAACFVCRLRLRGSRTRESSAAETDKNDLTQQRSNNENGQSWFIKFLKSWAQNLSSLMHWIKGVGPRLMNIITTTELFPCSSEDYVVKIHNLKETKTFLVLSWWQSTITILHILFGTLVFSGMLFVGTKDALMIVGRYIAGVAICRVILMYELAGLRQSCVEIDGEPPQTREMEKKLLKEIDRFMKQEKDLSLLPSCQEETDSRVDE
ncbi:hypothetical protein FNAPI_13084 [Fusarium napiforme]|uniref:Uncharacterized protein n=1 Tax=Fusarium napiforme TaxID=42672 RepID=A0A8H5I971_9HYPO|nr:hypothetical protein FNAPI_13084 [Fusarium napiforme]